MDKHIIDLEKQRFIRDCKLVMKGKPASNSLKKIISYSSPGHIEFLKRGLDSASARLIDIVIAKVKE